MQIIGNRLTQYRSSFSMESVTEENVLNHVLRTLNIGMVDRLSKECITRLTITNYLIN